MLCYANTTVTRCKKQVHVVCGQLLLILTQRADVYIGQRRRRRGKDIYKGNPKIDIREWRGSAARRMIMIMRWAASVYVCNINIPTLRPVAERVFS